MKSRAFAFTFNNYTEDDEKQLQSMDFTYLVYGREKAPETGTPHLQGYVYFKTQRSVKAMGAKFKWHLEPAKSDSLANRTYCTKSGDYFEQGDRPLTKKESSDKANEDKKEQWGQIILQAKLGTLEVENPRMYFLHYRTAEALRTKHMQSIPISANDTPSGVFYIGPSGCGKSRTARQENPHAYIKNCNKWWDGYAGQEEVIMDDLDPTLAKALAHHLKIWLDHYPFTAEIKGGSIFIRPRKIIITSQYTLDRLFEEAETLEAIKRRSRVWLYNDDVKSLELQ